MTEGLMPDQEMDAIARRSAEIMLENDRASAALGMTLSEVSAGRSVVHMRVRDDMVNGWGSAHGALIAAVADTAFAIACNSFGEITVAAGFDVSFLAPARVGDLLIATAVQRSGSGRSGIFDVTIERPDEEGRYTVVAEFRGRSRSLGRPVEPGAQA